MLPGVGTDQRNKTFLTCTWEEFEYSLLNPHEPATSSVIFYFLKALIELTYLDGKHMMPEHVNAMTLPHASSRSNPPVACDF